MEDLRLLIASNIINLRKEAKMTQAELAEKVGYSDKSISKWERAESAPDIFVLKQMSEIFGVSVDYIISSHDKWEPTPKKTILTEMGAKAITEICIIGISMLALLIFVIVWITMDVIAWITFVFAVPVALITLLVLHSVWQEGKYNFLIIAALVFSLLVSVYFGFYVFAGKNYWQLLLLLIPGELIVFLSSRIKRGLFKPHK